MHKTRFFSGIALLALSTGGCGLAAASPERDVLVPAEPTLIDFVDPATVPGLTTETITEGHATRGSRYVHITYPELSGAPALGRALREQAQRELGDFRARAGGEPADPRPELNVDWQLAAASPQAIAVRLRSGEYLRASWENATRTLWYDPSTGRTTGSTGLVAGGDALRRLAELVKEQFAGRGAQVERSEVTGGGDQFDSMAFNREGDLVVEFDDCQLAPCQLGRVAVAVPAKRATPLLSAFGRRAQQAAAKGPAGRRGGPAASPFAVPPRSPEATSSRAGTVDCAVAKCVALTFDDGPGPYTAELLDLLKREQVRATFFVVGGNAAAQPGLLRRMSDEGHLVGNHSWSHTDLSKQGNPKIADSLERTRSAVATAIGQAPTLVRPPYGAVSKGLRNVAREKGYALVTWDVDAMDQQGGATPDIADRGVRGAHPGAIILLHDIHRESVAAVPDILKRLRGKGYSFVTVPELYGPAGMQAGRLYRSGSEPSRKQPLT
ncbi:polysaccharide deacetylase family protein [Actinomadura sp. ATCC 31491]|uniref:Polysaccharide deacetylase family protein n=1 Tax=Actinomadura luzonensis TaxID=2805427 RepID=A0ABT0FS61_9ACTN|nr:polysaccharide deacetylase family protein [Actinomadura luzonensis]MCK2214741.1 polysaccharide deacetylase family protein [Actinomadura luzonensis]